MNQVSCLNSILLSKRKARFTKCSETLFSTFLCCCSISKSHRIQPNKRHVLTKQRSTLHYTSLRGRKALYVEERLRILLNPLLQRLSVCGALFQTIPCLFYILKSMGFLAGGDQTILWAVAARESSASHPTSEIFTLNVYTAWFAHLYTPVTHIDPFHGMKITQLKELELALRQIMLMDHDIIFICHVTSGSSCRFLYNAGDYAQNGNWIACCTVIRVRTSYPQTSRLSLEPWTSWHRPEGLPPS